MCFGWPERYDKYVTCGRYYLDGKRIVAEGAHVDADAPEDVKDFFRKANADHLTYSNKPIYTIH